MNKKIKKYCSLFICVVFAFLLVPTTARADVGPKPSVHITFEDLEDEICYGTLLSKNDSTGPSSAWDGIEANARHNENEGYGYSNLDYETWKELCESHGFIFNHWKIQREFNSIEDVDEFIRFLDSISVRYYDEVVGLND